MDSTVAFCVGTAAGVLAVLAGLVILAAWMSRDGKYDPGPDG